MSTEQTTPPTPDAGESESVRTLQRIRETCADVEAWQVWSADGALLEAYPGELLDHIASLTAQLAAAKADGEEARSVVTAMRRYLPAPGELPGETRISLREWEPLMQRIEALDAARTGAL